MQIITMVLAASGHWVMGDDNTVSTQPAFPQIVNTISWVAILQLIVIPFVIPVLTGLLAKAAWPTLAKRLLTGVLTLITSVGTALVGAATTGTALDVGSLIFQWALTWGVAELIYYKLYKAPVSSSTDIAGSATTIASILASKGNS